LILVECNPDEFFLTRLGFSKKNVRHVVGKGNVVKKLNRERNLIGLIDEDPGSAQPKELLSDYAPVEEKDSIKLLENKDHGKKIIQLSPDLEGWIIKRAHFNNIKMKDHGLPDDRKELHNIIHIEEKANFKSFVDRLVEIDEQVSLICRWIKEELG